MIENKVEAAYRRGDSVRQTPQADGSMGLLLRGAQGRQDRGIEAIVIRSPAVFAPLI